MSVPTNQTSGCYGYQSVAQMPMQCFFKYTPQAVYAALALGAFTVATAVVAWLVHRSKARFIHIVTATGLMEMAGYICMLYTIGQSGQSNVFPSYVAMQVFIVLAPNLIQVCDYSMVGRVVNASPDLARKNWLLSAKAIVWTFTGVDCVAITVQTIGIALWASARSNVSSRNNSQIKTGAAIVCAGLGIQLVSFVIFGWLANWVRRSPKNVLAGTRQRRPLFLGLFVNMAFLTIRNIFRFAEFLQSTILGWDNQSNAYVLADKEVLFYCLDTIPILICFGCFIFAHPGWYLPQAPAAEAAGAGPNGTTDKLEQAEPAHKGDTAMEEV